MPMSMPMLMSLLMLHCGNNVWRLGCLLLPEKGAEKRKRHFPLAFRNARLSITAGAVRQVLRLAVIDHRSPIAGHRFTGSLTLLSRLERHVQTTLSLHFGEELELEPRLELELDLKAELLMQLQLELELELELQLELELELELKWCSSCSIVREQQVYLVSL
ncbi:hypothetical protein AWZ03_005395 [Drosophila navojoa]|uniref:Secreted protein n=1 Tax=Drosophila navojoa TaxID=7232 RepID=A0A484BJJ4_DRONA|nr:hypothetical protein AWZ03_005395 [Drosophila navojoa]